MNWTLLIHKDFDVLIKILENFSFFFNENEKKFDKKNYRTLLPYYLHLYMFFNKYNVYAAKEFVYWNEVFLELVRENDFKKRNFILKKYFIFEETADFLNFIDFFNFISKLDFDGLIFLKILFPSPNQTFFTEPWFLTNLLNIYLCFLKLIEKENFFIKKPEKTEKELKALLKKNFIEHAYNKLLNSYFFLIIIFHFYESFSNDWIENIFLIKNKKFFFNEWTSCSLNSIINRKNFRMNSYYYYFENLFKSLFEKNNIDTDVTIWNLIFRKQVVVDQKFLFSTIFYYSYLLFIPHFPYIYLVIKKKNVSSVLTNVKLNNILVDKLKKLGQTNSWIVIINPIFKKNINKILWSSKQITQRFLSIKYIENVNVNKKFLNNSSYSYNSNNLNVSFWKENRFLINWDIEKEIKTPEFFNKINGTGLDAVISNINYLNQIPISIDKNIWSLVINHFFKDIDVNLDDEFDLQMHTSAFLKKIKKNSNSINNTKIESNAKALTSFLGEIKLIDNLDIDNIQTLSRDLKIIQKYATVKLVNSIVQRYKFFSNFFYFTYQLDNRGRIYVYNWPINYQLEHCIRHSIYFYIKNKPTLNKISNDYLELLNYFFYELQVSCDTKFFLYENLTSKNWIDLQNFFKNWLLRNEIKEELVNSNIFFSKIFSSFDIINFNQNLLSVVILVETWLDIFYKISVKNNNDWNSCIESGIAIFFDFIKQNFSDSKNLKSWTKYFKVKPRKFYEILNMHKICNNYYNDYKNAFFDVIYNDASANAVQLQTIKLLVPDSTLLQLTNIYNNLTPDRDIYSYLGNKINEMSQNDQSFDVFKKLELNKFLDRDFIKNILMPSCYGLTDYSIKERIDIYCEDSIEKKNIWKNIDLKIKNKFSLFIKNKMWQILKKHGFYLKNYLDLCNSYAVCCPNDCAWENSLGLPINIYYKKNNKRSDLLEKRTKINAQLHYNLYNIKEKLNLLELKTEEVIRFKELFEKDNIFFEHKLKKQTKNLSSEKLNYFKKLESTKKSFLNFIKLETHSEINKRWGLIEILLKKLIRIDTKLENVFFKRKLLKFKILNETIEYKTRDVEINTKIDFFRLSNGLPPHSTHSNDAEILLNSITDFKKIKIPLLVIHDSIGAPLIYSFYSKLVFKKNIIIFTNNNLLNPTFPVNKFFEINNKLSFKNEEGLTLKEKKFLDCFKKFFLLYENNKKNFNINEFKKQLIESKNFFN